MSTCTCDPHPDDLCGANENPVCIVCLSALIGPHNHGKLLFQDLVIENETLFLGERKQFSSFQMSLTRRAFQLINEFLALEVMYICRRHMLRDDRYTKDFTDVVLGS